MKYLLFLSTFALIISGCKKDGPVQAVEKEISDSCLNENYFFGSSTSNTWKGDLEYLSNTYTEAEGREAGNVNFAFREAITISLRLKLSRNTISDSATVFEPYSRLNEYFRSWNFNGKVTGKTEIDSFYTSKANEIKDWLVTHCK